MLRAFRAGTSIDLACDVAGIHRDTFFELQRRIRDGRAEAWEADFADKCHRARSNGHLELLERIIAAGRDPKEWKANAWALSKLGRRDFGADDKAASASPESKTREQLLAEVRAELDAMDSTIPSPQLPRTEPHQ
jgi:hypothetical protein